MRRRQILAQRQELEELKQLGRAAATNTPVVQERKLKPPADNEPCPLCGRKKIGRPKGWR